MVPPIGSLDLNGTGTSRGYSTVHELTSIGTQSQTFDTDGNMTVAHTGVDLAWDEAGMVKSTTVSAGDTAGIEGLNEYGYDASQKRVFKKITRNGSVAEHTVYIYAGPNCVAEYTAGTAASSPEQEYVYAQAIDSLVLIDHHGTTRKKLTVTRNQQWSISALSDNDDGTVLERYTYDVFGKRTVLAANGTTVRTSSDYNNQYGYTSRRHDEESGLMYFRARFYDPATGEFASQDPLEYVDGMSLMRGYFAPRMMDPTGNYIVFYDQQPDGTTLTIGDDMRHDDLRRLVMFGTRVKFIPADASDMPTTSADGCKCNKMLDANLVYPPGGTAQEQGRQYLDVGIPCSFGDVVILRYDGECVGENICCRETFSRCFLYVRYSCTKHHDPRRRRNWTGPNRTGQFIEWGWDHDQPKYGKCE